MMPPFHLTALVSQMDLGEMTAFGGSPGDILSEGVRTGSGAGRRMLVAA